MKLITALIRPERLPDVEAALLHLGLAPLALGPARQGAPLAEGAAPGERARLELACPDALVEGCLDALMAAARTTEADNGVVLVQPVDLVASIGAADAADPAAAPPLEDVLRRARAQLQDTAAWTAAERRPSP